MYSNDFINPQKNNSEVVKHVLDTLINIIKRKRGEEHAVSMMSSLLKELEAEHDFLQYIEIQDIRFLERGERVTVMPDINAVLPTEVGKALHIIISKLSLSLGDKDGYLLIREFEHRVESEYTSIFKTIGIDIELLLLEHKLAKPWS
jgi:hypothetical protein